MSPSFSLRSLAVTVLLSVLGACLVACTGNAPPPAESGFSHPDPSASSAAGDPSAPCGPNDCTPCDETKQKCMGPMVCDGHPEQASRQCKRDSAGVCKDMIVCASTP
ncbi:MAG: hypothetical protein ABI551_27310 [Polyangiaceae bacterium]